MNELEHLREWAFHGGGPRDDDAPMVYEEYLRAALPAIDALIEAARAYITGPGREFFDPAQAASNLEAALARLEGKQS